MKYIFTVEKASVKPKKKAVTFEADSDQEAYKYVIDEIINNPDNKPLQEGLLRKDRGEVMMGWSRGKGWYFLDPSKESKLIDRRPTS
jgi:predicted lipase